MRINIICPEFLMIK